MLDATFPPYSPGSRRWYEFADAGEEHLLAREVGRTLEAAAASAPARQAKGALTREEADRIALLWLAISEDLEAQHSPPVTRTLAERLAQLRDKHGVAWSAKVEALRGEIALRRAGYPALVAKGQLTAEQAKQQIERLEAVHDLYWRQGFAFDGAREDLRAMTGPILDQDVEQQGAAVVAPATQAAA